MHDVLSEIASHVDEHSALFLRFDKQGLVAGSLRLGSADAVRVKVKPRGFIPKGGADAFYAGLLRGA
jgi:RNA binding exosome subunit